MPPWYLRLRVQVELRYLRTTALSHKRTNSWLPADTFVAEYLDHNQRSLVEKVLTGVLHQEVAVHFQVAQSAAAEAGTGPGGRPAQQGSLPVQPPVHFRQFRHRPCNQLATLHRRWPWPSSRARRTIPCSSTGRGWARRIFQAIGHARGGTTSGWSASAPSSIPTNS